MAGIDPIEEEAKKARARRTQEQVQIELNDRYTVFWRRESAKMPPMPQGTRDMLKMFGQLAFLEGASQTADIINALNP